MLIYLKGIIPVSQPRFALFWIRLDRMQEEGGNESNISPDRYQIDVRFNRTILELGSWGRFPVPKFCTPVSIERSQYA